MYTAQKLGWESTFHFKLSKEWVVASKYGPVYPQNFYTLLIENYSTNWDIVFKLSQKEIYFWKFHTPACVRRRSTAGPVTSVFGRHLTVRVAYISSSSIRFQHPCSHSAVFEVKHDRRCVGHNRYSAVWVCQRPFWWRSKWKYHVSPRKYYITIFFHRYFNIAATVGLLC